MPKRLPEPSSKQMSQALGKRPAKINPANMKCRSQKDVWLAHGDAQLEMFVSPQGEEPSRLEEGRALARARREDLCLEAVSIPSSLVPGFVFCLSCSHACVCQFYFGELNTAVVYEP